MILNYHLRRILPALFAALALSFIQPAFAQDAAGPTKPAGDTNTAKTNFSGRWRMVKDKSNFGSFTVPDMVIQVIDQHTPTMNVHTIETIGKTTTTADVTYFTDGTIAKNVMHGHEAESRAFWDGPVLVIRTTEQAPKNGEVVMEDRWELSSDGQTLTRTSHITTAKGGHADMTLVSEKETVGG